MAQMGSAEIDLDLPGVLSREQILARIAGDPPLLSEFINLDDQAQPNGFDLTLESVSRFADGGIVAADNRDRILPDLEALPFNDEGYIDLAAGAYHIVYNEVVRLPLDLMALGRPRSSLGRCGTTIHTAVWDAGYHGRSTSLLAVANPNGIRLQRNAKVMQLVFLGLSRQAAAGYQGRYQGENLMRR